MLGGQCWQVQVPGKLAYLSCGSAQVSALSRSSVYSMISAACGA
jgi:hypothetical protein